MRVARAPSAARAFCQRGSEGFHAAPRLLADGDSWIRLSSSGFQVSSTSIRATTNIDRADVLTIVVAAFEDVFWARPEAGHSKSPTQTREDVRGTDHLTGRRKRRGVWRRVWR